MNTQNWKFFTKEGSNMNVYADSYVNLEFVTTTQNAIGAEVYALTDTSALVTGVHVVNNGWQYPPDTQINIAYVFGNPIENLSQQEASIIWKDVSIFNPSPINSKGIGNVIMDLSTYTFVYPSVSFASAIFLKPISQGLVETEHITILEETPEGKWIRPYDPINYTLVLRMDSAGDKEIKLFEINEDNQLVEWTDELIFDVSLYTERTGLMVNIGFRSDDEGVYERKLRIFHLVGGQEYLLSEILVNAESIGPDERFDSLIANFGLPAPKDTPSLFKEADINEDLPDWQLLNYKGKHIILEYDKIMPYIGSYKALINAIKWLGYEDIQVKEWFRNVKDKINIALTVPYEAADRTKTILYFTPDERRNLKKLNQLSLVYCITRETGEYDEWGNPLIEDCYNYNLNEILIKLFALKNWLEKWIIGVNARITDITGEGVYFERFQNFIYAIQNKGSVANYIQSLTPIALTRNSELVKGDASILLTLLELEKTNMKNYNLRLQDLISYYWDPSNGAFSPEDASSVVWDPSTIFIGSTFQFPFSLYDIQWRASVEKTDAGILTDNLVTKPLFVYENEIRFWDVTETYSKFYDVSTDLDIILEKAYLRDPSNDVWEDSISYSIYPATNGAYWLESSLGIRNQIFGYAIFTPDVSSELIYELDLNYKIPLLSFKNYRFVDGSLNVINFNKKYYLDILDGKIYMDSSILGPKNEIVQRESYLNFNYDTSLNEQKITLNVVYNSPRMPIAVYDPSLYWYFINELGQDPYPSRVIDNSIYQFNVNFTGNYQIEIFGWDGQNNIFRNNMKSLYSVWTKFPQIVSYLDNSIMYYDDTSVVSCLNICTSTLLSPEDISALIASNIYPIFDKIIPLQGLTLEYDDEGLPFIRVPSISYFIDIPEVGSITRFYNLTERCVSINTTTVVVDPDYQEFFNGDNVNLVLWDKKSLSMIEEVSTHITAISGNTLTLGVPSRFINQESSTELYILNDTERTVSNLVNGFTTDGSITFPSLNLDISSYSFRHNQLVGMIISEPSTGYRWGSSFRVHDVSGNHHVLEGQMPNFVIANPAKYKITAKHSFSSFADFQVEVAQASEVANNFETYLNDIYHYQYYLDNTFVFVNILFDQEYVLDQWYDPSTDKLVSGSYYPFNQALYVDTSTLVIFTSYFDPSNYMINQKNIWTVWNNSTKQIVFKVFNDIVPFIFDKVGVYDVQLEAYDKYGNLKAKYWEGLLTVNSSTNI
ncbi:MAG: hypothetical protein PHF86_02320 [Candidatus Nanoarchaeia archaeon]|nr:hypothetical protein [Candidatus Nanoarchaeia archaeon]